MIRTVSKWYVKYYYFKGLKKNGGKRVSTNKYLIKLQIARKERVNNVLLQDEIRGWEKSESDMTKQPVIIKRDKGRVFLKRCALYSMNGRMRDVACTMFFVTCIYLFILFIFFIYLFAYLFIYLVIYLFIHLQILYIFYYSLYLFILFLIYFLIYSVTCFVIQRFIYTQIQSNFLVIFRFFSLLVIFIYFIFKFLVIFTLFTLYTCSRLHKSYKREYLRERTNIYISLVIYTYTPIYVIHSECPIYLL